MEIEGLNDFSDMLNNSCKKFNKEAEKALVSTGNKLLRKVKLKTPVAEVDGGTLQKNWRSKKDGELSRIIYNNTDYALHVEYGHRTRLGKGKSNPPKYKYKPKENGKKMVDGRYMLTKSVAEIESELEKEFSIMIDKLWK